MKKAALIIVGVLILLIALLIGLYLLFFSTPQSAQEVFANLGFGDAGNTVVVPVENPLPETDTNLVDTQGEALRQLTTRAVAGMAEYTEDSSTFVRYAEIGTGHIFQINLTTGAEDRVSGTTIPRVVSASFSPNGEFVALTSETDNIQDTFAGAITVTDGTGSIDGANLPPQAHDITLTNTGDVRYTLSDTSGSTGYNLNLDTLETDIVFTTLFSQIRTTYVGEEAFFYNRFAAEFEGSLYTISNKQSVPAAATGFGFLALPGENYIITTITQNDITAVLARNRTTNAIQNLPIYTIPEKCVFDSSSSDILWCGAPISDIDTSFVTSWYKGAIISPDLIWRINLATGEAEFALDPQETTGRRLDILSPQMNGSDILLRNKTDNTLWLYDTTTL